MPNSNMIIVSACLAGCRTRYDGKDNQCEAVMELVRRGRAIPVCPEQLGGLPTPRPCCEIINGKVMNTEGQDVTPQFSLGAEEALRLAKMAGCKTAVLKKRSPSCGSSVIYDGTFSGTLIPGEGLFAAMCRHEGMIIFDEENFTLEDAPCHG